ncbi:UPF0184 protein C9orf16 -like protein [Collichthys lucidus]|uniref:UPF0184 protein C9orf16-like protein n=1 Tax=Collichthys lucidus TaxID=240159 RepID=A0A4U5V8X3_COLLU|nr:UPF0184 protein C9orf16 -like protein [Collichthys lucidus]
MSGPNGDPDMSIDEGIINDEDDFGDEEVNLHVVYPQSMKPSTPCWTRSTPTSMILEERNDSLNGKLHELMESNRQARLEFRAQLLSPTTQEEKCPTDGDSSSSTPSKEDLKEDLKEDSGDGN